MLRTSVEPNGYYAARFWPSGKGNISLLTYQPDLQESILTEFQLNTGPEHDCLFTITGSDLRLWVDGRLVATAHDTAVAGGRPGIGLAEDGAAFRDLAIAELPADFASKLAPISTGAAATTGAAGSAVVWHDMLAEWRKIGFLSAPNWKDDGSRAEALVRFLGGTPSLFKAISSDQAIRSTCTAPAPGKYEHKFLLRAYPVNSWNE